MSSEFQTAGLSIKVMTLWGMAPSSFVHIYQRFGRTYRLQACPFSFRFLSRIGRSRFLRNAELFAPYPMSSYKMSWEPKMLKGKGKGVPRQDEVAQGVPVG
jgi:hypothetical protein